MKIYVSNHDDSVETMFKRRGHTCLEYFSPKDIDVFVLSGGADIGPWLYGERLITGTKPNFVRDNMEIGMWKMLDRQVPKVGICRGAQLGNVLCGGRLWQDVDGHEGYSYHDVAIDYGEKGRIIPVNTLHHQMCEVTKDARVLATANESKIYKGDSRAICPKPWTDVEAFFYEYQNFLGVQWHPEYDEGSSEDLFFEFFDDYFTKPLEGI